MMIDCFKMGFIDSIHTENTGGGWMVDFVVLKDGRVLGIDDEYVVLYKSMEDFYEYHENKNNPYIKLSED